LKPRFQPDGDSGGPTEPSPLIDPEAYDASEQQFAASLDDPGEPPGPRFIVEEEGPSPGEAPVYSDAKLEKEPSDIAPPGALNPSCLPELARDSWKEEVAARVTHYRARHRQRAPRYPSLQLKFDTPEPSIDSVSTLSSFSVAPVPNRLALARQDSVVPSDERSDDALSETSGIVEIEPGAKILEFPRSAASPVVDELAGPVVVQPRILEVPEVLPPPPALGGILIEPAEEPGTERRPGFELPLQAARLSRRVLAGAIDALVVFAGFALFAYGFFRITATVPPGRLAATSSLVLMVVFWFGYQYLLLAHSGTTIGLRLAKLELKRFDGSRVPLGLRRWRVLASALSGSALFLGYAWCFLDEDELCWHDRITHTYMAPK